jgi:hypothetical protein
MALEDLPVMPLVLETTGLALRQWVDTCQTAGASV